MSLHSLPSGSVFFVTETMLLYKGREALSGREPQISPLAAAVDELRNAPARIRALIAQIQTSIPE